MFGPKCPPVTTLNMTVASTIAFLLLSAGGCFPTASLAAPDEPTQTPPAQQAPTITCPPSDGPWWRGGSLGYPPRLRCGTTDYAGAKIDWWTYRENGATHGATIPPTESDVVSYIPWPRGLPVEVILTGGVPEKVILSVRRWLRPDEMAALDNNSDRVAKTLKTMLGRLPLEREVVLDTKGPMRWWPDVAPGRYLVVVRANYDWLGSKEMAEVAFPVEFR
jgi:hypothetical protein